MSNPILIYSPFTSKRLLYVLDWVFKSRLGIDYILTHTQPGDSDFYISYGAVANGGICIPSYGLLQQTGIKLHDIKTGDWNSIPTIYAFSEPGYHLPFDFFSAIFFLLSRYEEYYPYTADKHGRYPAKDSILCINSWLERPLVDEWVEAFRVLLEKKGNAVIAPKQFSFLPTYDIDIAWSYKNKGFIRSIGAAAKDLLHGNLTTVIDRIAVLSGSKKDPYYSFDSISALHKKYKYSPVYFVLAANQTGPFDKNISPANPGMQKLIRFFSHDGVLGIHPSYEMNNTDSLLSNEKNTLEKISGIKITQSRQHYIRLWLPQTYRQLVHAGITDDYSMGYGTHIGFRAGTGNIFRWYDIEKEEPAALHIHPFCFMDSTAHYEMNLSAPEAFERLGKMAALLKKAHSPLTTVFHNFSLGTDAEWKGWAEAYALFLEKMAK